MNSNKNYSPFVEHSFRRLSLLIHQQNDQNISNSYASNQIAKQSSFSSVNKMKTNEKLVPFSAKLEFRQQSTNDKSLETKSKAESTFKTRRTYMRPPKNQRISIFSL